ncbi:membrane-associated phospholipid phosphatase [Alkalibacillus almallahensis]|nr:membrane-associated phospholipid phosphatase [Alkalibacillus almallahensis]
MFGISGLTKGLKLLFERQRLETLEQFDRTGFSFPSDHSTGVITFYGFMIYLTVNLIINSGEPMSFSFSIWKYSNANPNRRRLFMWFKQSPFSIMIGFLLKLPHADCVMSRF